MKEALRAARRDGCFGAGLAMLVLGGLVASTALALPADRIATQQLLRSWGIPEGLPQGSVYALAQTPDGYLWVGTGEGLARFDGVRFVVFDCASTPELGADSVSSLVVDTVGSLWVGVTGGGVARLERGRFSHFGRAQGLPEDTVNGFVVDRAGTLWAATGAGVARFDGQRFAVAIAGRELPHPSVDALAVEGDGTLWAGTRFGLVRVRGGERRRFGTADGLPDEAIRDLAVESDGALRVATRSGLARCRGERCERIATGFAAMNSLQEVLEDRDGGLWVAS